MIADLGFGTRGSGRHPVSGIWKTTVCSKFGVGRSMFLPFRIQHPTSNIQYLISAVSCTLILLFAGAPAAAGELTAKQILDRAAKPYDAVEDYIVDAKVAVESPSVHVPEMPVKVYFKQPDKLHLESRDGFAVLPKRGVIVGNPLRELMTMSELSVGGSERVLGTDCWVIKGTHLQEGRSVQSTVWIDKKDWLVRQVYTDPEWGPSVKVKLWYSKVAKKYWLPRSTAAQIWPPPIPGSDSAKEKPGRSTIVHIRFSKYRVNTGLGDEIFER